MCSYGRETFKESEKERVQGVLFAWMSEHLNLGYSVSDL